jgi:hypothetical protein
MIVFPWDDDDSTSDPTLNSAEVQKDETQNQTPNQQV